MAGTVDGILLAGGCSCRAGVFKMEAIVGGKPLLLWGLEAMAVACERVIVVAGCDAEKIAGLVAGRPGVELVINERYAQGMLSSVQAGVARVRARRFFLLPGDMPLVRPAVFRELLRHEGDIVVPACDGRRGHPVLLAGSLAAAILAEPSGSNLGVFIHRHGCETVDIDDPGIFADLDHPQDLKKLDATLRARSGHE
jgi:molybdenum cofactor cytidylyltransferase